MFRRKFSLIAYVLIGCLTFLVYAPKSRAEEAAAPNTVKRLQKIESELDQIEKSQAQEKNIKEHISSFRVNEERYNLALKDVQTMEELLEAVRENLERSLLKNVLQKVKGLKSVSQIAEALFGIKPSINNTWKIITGIVIFVGLLTAVHFFIWGRRSKDIKTTQNPQQKTTQV